MVRNLGLPAALSTRRRMPGSLAALVGLASLVLAACEAKSGPNSGKKDPSAPAQQGPTGAGSGKPGAASDPNALTPEQRRARLQNVPTREQVEARLNPKKLPNYAGPTGTIRGTVRAIGDAAPVVPIKDAEPNCELAVPMFGRLFREGPERQLADVLVTATHYEGHLPPKQGAVTVYGSGCAWDRRTIALDFGQYIEVVARDRRAYVPELLGERTVAQLFALPNGEPIPLVPSKVGRFVLHDSMRIYSRANVYVLAYPTHSVTGIDGHYEIQGIPVGKVKIGAILPETGRTVVQDVVVEPNQVVTLDLELPFDQKKYDEYFEKASEELKGATRATNATP